MKIFERKHKVLCISSSYPVHPRLKKIGDSFLNYSKDNTSCEVQYMMWDRLNFGDDDNYFVYKSNEGYGKKLKKIIGLFSYAYFMKKTISAYNPTMVICRYVDMAFLGCILFRKGIVVYDVNDIPADESKIASFIFSLMEKYVLKKVNLIVLSSRFFESRYKEYSHKIEILENKPQKIINN